MKQNKLTTSRCINVTDYNELMDNLIENHYQLYLLFKIYEASFTGENVPITKKRGSGTTTAKRLIGYVYDTPVYYSRYSQAIATRESFLDFMECLKLSFEIDLSRIRDNTTSNIYVITDID